MRRFRIKRNFIPFQEIFNFDCDGIIFQKIGFDNIAGYEFLHGCNTSHLA